MLNKGRIHVNLQIIVCFFKKNGNWGNIREIDSALKNFHIVQGVPYYWTHFVFRNFSGSGAPTEELFTIFQQPWRNYKKQSGSNNMGHPE